VNSVRLRVNLSELNPVTKIGNDNCFMV
jgi:hypothetical protein